MPQDQVSSEGKGEPSPTVRDERAQDENARDEPMLWCPVCSLKLQQRKCKLFCERCGYYMSCADYY